MRSIQSLPRSQCQQTRKQRFCNMRSNHFHILRMLILTAQMRMHAVPSVSLASAGYSASPTPRAHDPLSECLQALTGNVFRWRDVLIHLAKVVRLD